MAKMRRNRTAKPDQLTLGLLEDDQDHDKAAPKAKTGMVRKQDVTRVVDEPTLPLAASPRAGALAEGGSGGSSLSAGGGPGNGDGQAATARNPEPEIRNPKPETRAPAVRVRRAVVDHKVAEGLATKQREISVSEFFAKNRHLLGFDNKRKALLTSVKEAVDNSLDACEEAGVLPDIEIEVRQLAEDRFRIAVQDNGPGIVKAQIPNVFGKLLYGSKFHRLKMSRGQQGIGISAAGMYGLLTTGMPVVIVSRTGPSQPAHHFELRIDTAKNRPDIIKAEKVEVDWPHGTRVEIEMTASYAKGRQSVDEYVLQTAIANPHARFAYKASTGETVTYEQGVEQLPPATHEIKPHPYGIDLGLLLRMLKESTDRGINSFLQKNFSRVSPAVAREACRYAGLALGTRPAELSLRQAEALYQGLQKTKIKNPPTDCLAPIGAKQILAGLLQGVKAEFYTAITREPAVYRGHPFLIEVGLAYGGQLPAEESAKIIRFANRVPLLYQQSACTVFKSVLDTNWRNYGLQQPNGSLPVGPLVVMVHMASVWVPFTSESKEAIADYDEISKEIRLALQECGRKLSTYLRKRKRQQREGQRRSVFIRYIREVVEAVNSIKRIDKDKFRDDLLNIAQHHTQMADVQLDDAGRPVVPEEEAAEPTENGIIDDTTIVVAQEQAEPPPAEDVQLALLDVANGEPAAAKGQAGKPSRRERKAS